MQGMKFVGTVYMGDVVPVGQRPSYDKLGNCDKFAPKPNAETKEQISNMRENHGQALDGVTDGQPMDFAMEVSQMGPDIVAMQFQGAAVKREGLADTVTDEPFTAVLDKWADLPGIDISSEEITNSAADTTYVKDTDYEINLRTGMVKPLSTGSITEAEALLADFDIAAEEGWDIDAATTPEIRKAFFFDGKNKVNGKDCLIYIDEMLIKPTSEFDVLSKDYLKGSFEGTPITREGETSPLRIIYQE